MFYSILEAQLSNCSENTLFLLYNSLRFKKSSTVFIVKLYFLNTT